MLFLLYLYDILFREKVLFVQFLYCLHVHCVIIINLIVGRRVLLSMAVLMISSEGSMPMLQNVGSVPMCQQ